MLATLTLCAHESPEWLQTMLPLENTDWDFSPTNHSHILVVIIPLNQEVTFYVVVDSIWSTETPKGSLLKT